MLMADDLLYRARGVVGEWTFFLSCVTPPTVVP